MSKENTKNLTKVLGEMFVKADSSKGNVVYYLTDSDIKPIVKYLSDKGVICPCCNLGDDVYIIPRYGGKPYCGILKDKIQMIGYTSRGFHIKARNHRDHNKTYMLGNGAYLDELSAKNALEKMLNEI